MTQESKTEHPARDAVTRLETIAITPLIPGELAEWVDQTRLVLQEATAILRKSWKERDRAIWDEIITQDPEMGHRVERMRIKEQELEDDLRSITDRLESWHREVSLAGKREPRWNEEDHDAWVDDVLLFVGRVRRFVATRSTWHQEAFTRDRGIVD